MNMEISPVETPSSSRKIEKISSPENEIEEIIYGAIKEAAEEIKLGDDRKEALNKLFSGIEEHKGMFSADTFSKLRSKIAEDFREDFKKGSMAQYLLSEIEKRYS